MKTIRRALMTGVSYMLPFIVCAGLLIGFTGILTTYFSIESATLAALNGFAWAIMDIIPAIFAAYCAFAIADKPGICVGFLGGWLAANPVFEGTAASGFLGALAAGLLAGYMVKWLKKLPFPAVLAPVKSAILLPLLSVVAIYFIMAYPVGYAVGLLNTWLIGGLLAMAANPALAVLLGAVLSTMCAADMGGPLGKIAITFVFAVWADPSGLGFMVNAAVFPGIMVPALSVGIASLLAPAKFTDSERKSAPAAIITGLVGITEGTLPYAFRDPLFVIGPNVVGAAVGGAMVMALGISTPGVSGVIGIAPASSPLLLSACVLAGVAVSVTGMVLLKKPVPATGTVQAEADLDLEIVFD